jgi:hypothetical protein
VHGAGPDDADEAVVAAVQDLLHLSAALRNNIRDDV